MHHLMKPPIAFFVFLTTSIFLGCQTPPGVKYAKQHPELTPQQRTIFTEKKVTDINAVAGLTKEQIRIALGEPTQFDHQEGSEVWIYVRRNSEIDAENNMRAVMSGTDRGSMAGAGVGGTHMTDLAAVYNTVVNDG
jgi:outer membrane protein assembly factor BamE (lipoprotein component of BamABCDE complex)